MALVLGLPVSSISFADEHHCGMEHEGSADTHHSADHDPKAQTGEAASASKKASQGSNKREVKTQVVEMSVTSEGFVPARIKVKVGQPVKLVVTRKTERTCATEIVVKDYGVKVTLPLNKAVDVTFTPKKTGEVRYACAMDMIAGVLVVE
jgi:plastocyanin